MRQDESQPCEDFLALRLKKKMEKGHNILDREGDKTYLGLTRDKQERTGDRQGQTRDSQGQIRGGQGQNRDSQGKVASLVIYQALHIYNLCVMLVKLTLK